MRPHYPTLLITFGIILLNGTGCASLNKVFHWNEGGTDEASDYDGDPVAAAAMRLRRPASSQAADASEDRSWNRRYAPPAETISYGMAMDEVTAVWGEPNSVESAGDAHSGNQRWTYYSGLSSRYGLGTKRIVYFENGQVAGWKN